ncbi:hypothetical protein L6V77_29810 [Myxococcota bacterium]|nr:hypothetical protein [Myxococcota bacterium]
MGSRPLLLAAVAAGVAGCFYDPHATLDGVDLHVIVLRLDSRATRVEVSARSASSTDAATLVRTLAPEPGGRAEVFVPRLPEGRFVVQARARDAEGSTLACARLDRTLDAAAAPHDVTLDMDADHAPCVDVDVPGTDARVDDPSGRPDAGPDDDGRPGAADRDMRLRRDAKPDDDEKH